MMQVTVDTIVSQRAFGVIFSGTVSGCGHPDVGRRLRFRAASSAMAGEVGVGETWTIEGRLASTAYGPQVEVRQGRRVMTGGLIRKFLANHAPGIGDERAARLWSAFGEGLGGILVDDGRMQEVADVLAPGMPVLGMRLAASVMRCWREAAGEAAVLAWLDGVGVEDVRLARRLYRLCGDNAPELLQSNPYALVPLISWRTLDAIGRRLLADDPYDRRRLVGAVDECIKSALATGSTAVLEPELERAVGKLLNTSSPVIAADAIAYAEHRGSIVRSGLLLRAPGAAAMEGAVESRLKSLLLSGPHFDAVDIDEALEKALEALAPHPQQMEAARSVLGRPMACLVGGAGTGKTYTCRMIVDAWEQLGGNVVLCALAGKAALRLSRSTGRLAKTLTRTLGELRDRARIEENGPSDATEARKLETLVRIAPGTLVLVDEASMVDLPTMHALLRHLPEGCHLLLVGDEAQLPPVGFGLVFHRLVLDNSITIRLTHVHRQAASTGIPTVAASVRQRVLPDLPTYAGAADGVFHLDAPLESLQVAVCRVAEDLGAAHGHALVVAATNGGESGVDALNAIMQMRRLDEDDAPSMRGHLGRIHAIGDPVIFGRNDYGAGLVNGLMGKVTEVFPESMTIEVGFDGEERRKLLDSDQMLDLTLAHAVTCHKMQGSSAMRIVVPLHPTRLMDPSWLYTALTRAERQVVFVGPLDIAREALSRPWVADSRLVGFNWEGDCG